MGFHKLMIREGWATTAKVLALACLLAAVGLASLLLPRPDSVQDLVELPWWAFALLFAVTEACVVQVRMRRHNHSVSVSEVPLVIGLFLAAPGSLILGRVIGSLAVFLLYRRQKPVKAFFNTALVVAGTGAAKVTFFVVLGGTDPLAPRACIAALLAASAAALLDVVALLPVQRWYDGAIELRDTLATMGRAALVAAGVGLVGVIPVLALSRGEAALPVAAAGALALIGYRAFATLSDRHTSLERMYELSDALAAAPGSADVVRSVLCQSLDLLHAGYAEVMLDGLGNGVQLWSGRVGGDPLYGPVEAGRHHLSLPFPPLGMRIVRGVSAEEREFLEARDISEAVIVPLRIDGQVAGHVVADRASEDRRFTAAEVRMLETVANHASVALRNGRLIEQLHFEARHDELTGLANRLDFREQLDAVAEVAAGRCAVMVLDFNGFKAINDSLGHQAGDELLRVLAGRFRDAVGDRGLVARLGGDEFAVIVPDCPSVELAEQVADDVLAAFEVGVPVGSTRLRVGGSLGIALGPEHGTSGTELMRKADLAMYTAKSAAGGRRFYSEEMQPTAAFLTLATDLRDALDHDAIGIALQPLVDLASGAVHSVEVLARWTHPVHGRIAPEEFFAAAERNGMVRELSERVLDQALAVSRGWMDEGRPLRMAVNLAPRWLSDPGLPARIDAALTRHGVPAELLCLEITESGVIAQPGRTTEILERLRAMGVHLSVDDFGTGYSSLTHLSRLPVDQMKIDKAFVQQMHGSGRDRAIVQSIIDLGRNLGLEVVAEGVTDGDTRRILREMGCRLGQGYLFSEPLPAADLCPVVERLGVVSSPLRAPGRTLSAVDVSRRPSAEQLGRALAGIDTLDPCPPPT